MFGRALCSVHIYYNPHWYTHLLSQSLIQFICSLTRSFLRSSLCSIEIVVFNMLSWRLLHFASLYIFYYYYTFTSVCVCALVCLVESLFCFVLLLALLLLLFWLVFVFVVRILSFHLILRIVCVWCSTPKIEPNRATHIHMIRACIVQSYSSIARGHIDLACRSIISIFSFKPTVTRVTSIDHTTLSHLKNRESRDEMFIENVHCFRFVFNIRVQSFQMKWFDFFQLSCFYLSNFRVFIFVWFKLVFVPNFHLVFICVTIQFTTSTDQEWINFGISEIERIVERSNIFNESHFNFNKL